MRSQFLGVQVVHGINDLCLDFSGCRVGKVYDAVSSILNVPPIHVARVNGIRVDWDYQLNDGEVLEFFFPWGRKGAAGDDYNEFAKLNYAQKLNDLFLILKRIERKIDDQSEQKLSPKDFYTVPEFAKLIDLEADTVREHCRLGRLKADKGVIGRGGISEWRISNAELIRYRNHGLLPLRKN